MKYEKLIIGIVCLIGTVVPVILFWNTQDDDYKHKCPDRIPSCQQDPKASACVTEDQYKTQPVGSTCPKYQEIPVGSPLPLVIPPPTKSSK